MKKDCTTTIFGSPTILLICSIAVLGIFVCGCRTPEIRPVPVNPGNIIYVNHNILYPKVKGFPVYELMDKKTGIVCQANRDFGAILRRPLVPKKGSPADVAIKLVPLLKKDLEKEKRSGITSVERKFGDNTFLGFGYSDRASRDVLDGYFLVGKYLIEIQIYLPEPLDRSNRVVLEKLTKILSEVKVNKP